MAVGVPGQHQWLYIPRPELAHLSISPGEAAVRSLPNPAQMPAPCSRTSQPLGPQATQIASPLE